VVISLDSLQTSQFLFLGAILAVAASLASSYATVLIRRTIKGENIIVTLAIQMSLGCIILVISALIFEDIRDFHIVAETVGSILYLAVLGTVTAFFGYYWLLARTKAVVVSLITFVAPIISILIGMVGFSETFSNGVILGSAMILSGVMMVIKK
jgi:drug/metabolite transporter (DMT)-like permease